MVVVEVEAGFTDGNDVRVPQSLTQPGLGFGAPLVRIVRVHARRGRKPGLRRREPERCLGTGARFADHHDSTNAGSPGALEHFCAIGCVSLVC